LTSTRRAAKRNRLQRYTTKKQQRQRPMQTTPKTVTKTKAVMTANKQTAPELHFQEICLIESTTSFTDAFVVK
jgi:hypothetical protein